MNNKITHGSMCNVCVVDFHGTDRKPWQSQDIIDLALTYLIMSINVEPEPECHYVRVWTPVGSYVGCFCRHFQHSGKGVVSH